VPADSRYVIMLYTRIMKPRVTTKIQYEYHPESWFVVVRPTEWGHQSGPANEMAHSNSYYVGRYAYN
jgi:hypothetical protein